MKQLIKPLVAAATFATAALVQPVQAQTISLAGINASGGYGSWSGAGVFSTGPQGIRVQAPVSGGFGGVYVDLGGGATHINASSTQVTVNFSVNNGAANYIWIGAPFNPNDGLGQAYNYYSGSGNPGNPAGAVWTGTNVSLTWSLTPTELAAVQGGSDTIYGFNIGIDPSAVVSANIDLTYNSVVFSAPSTSIQITAQSFNPQTQQFTLTWTSSPGKNYTVLSTSDLTIAMTPLATGIASGGTTTTTTVTMPAGAVGFVRIEQQ
jgi:hypothetical protein